MSHSCDEKAENKNPNHPTAIPSPLSIEPALNNPVRLRMRTSFSSAHSAFTRFSKQRRKGGQQVPRALCPTHLSRSKCSSPVPPNAPISRQRSLVQSTIKDLPTAEAREYSACRGKNCIEGGWGKASTVMEMAKLSLKSPERKERRSYR
ncbi:hypothetical protein HAX54_048783 [Datura stramonium]|uniref:Uncharacterized protein n=1 Tax=Datura stramonium TaxID=4076 RepID=A0ABS8WJN6_DATST|nr:hypothetical protein [Datura stramonium]